MVGPIQGSKQPLAAEGKSLGAANHRLAGNSEASVARGYEGAAHPPSPSMGKKELLEEGLLEERQSNGATDLYFN